MKNKTTKERNWDNHIDLPVKICEGKDRTQAIAGFQCYRHCVLNLVGLCMGSRYV